MQKVMDGSLWKFYHMCGWAQGITWHILEVIRISVWIQDFFNDFFISFCLFLTNFMQQVIGGFSCECGTSMDKSVKILGLSESVSGSIMFWGIRYHCEIGQSATLSLISQQIFNDWIQLKYSLTFICVVWLNTNFDNRLCYYCYICLKMKLFANI